MKKIHFKDNEKLSASMKKKHHKLIRKSHTKFAAPSHDLAFGLQF